ncbi:hypothetical protein [Streptomyces hokutonensis]|uniref:hypothetical protein n=1 Tax=Streptomyces hokutonensis TaxID=1306990 RepID=UPI0036952D79
MMVEGSAEAGRPAPSRADRAAALQPGGTVFVGSPDEIADRILHLHGLLGIELLGTKVLPQIRAELATP